MLGIQDSMKQFNQKESHFLTPTTKKNKILVFSPDRDLAESLTMLFEDQFEITSETLLRSFEHTIDIVQPSLLIVDLHTFSSDVMLQLKILDASKRKVPVVVLRAYSRLRPDVEELIGRVASVVFYKPINADEVVASIHTLLNVVP